MGLNTRLNNGVIAGNVPSHRDGCSMSADSAAVRITFRKVTVSVAMEGLRVLGASSCMHPEEYNIVQLTVPHGNSVRVARPIEASFTAVPPAQSCDGISCQGLYEVPFRGKSAAGIRRTYVPHPYNITSGGSDSDLRGLGGSRHSANMASTAQIPIPTAAHDNGFQTARPLNPHHPGGAI